MSMILIDDLGHGSFGEVFACRFEDAKGRLPRELLTETWAVKKIQKDDATVNNVIRELHSFEKKDTDRATARALRIPYRPAVFYDSHIWIVMEKFTMSCADWFQYGLNTNDYRRAFRALLTTCAFLHGKGSGHRDIKPKNMLINVMTGNIVVADFGSTSLLEGPQYTLHQVCTLDTRAPEFFQEENRGLIANPTTYRADIWSIGITMLCAFFKKPHSPFGSIHMYEEYPEEMRQILSKKFAKSKDDPFSEFIACAVGPISLSLENAVQLVRTLVPNQMARSSASFLLNNLEIPITPLVRRRRTAYHGPLSSFVDETIVLKPTLMVDGTHYGADYETSVPEAFHQANLEILANPVVLPSLQHIFQSLYSKKAIARIKNIIQDSEECAVRVFYLVCATIAHGFHNYDMKSNAHKVFSDPSRFKAAFREILYEGINQL